MEINMTEDYIVEVTNCGTSKQQVNLKTYACSCKDWKNRRAQQPMNCPERLCKHLIAAICENGLEGEFPDADLQSLYKKKKGYPLPAKGLSYFLEQYFQQELTTEDLQRIDFLFSNGNKFNNFNKFQQLTVNGPTFCRFPSRNDMNIVCKRLSWAGLAEAGAEYEYCDLVPALDIKELKKLGTALDIEIKSKATGVKVLSEIAELDKAFTECGFSKNDFFVLKPITLDMLR